jgi:hypothetical protein
VGVVDLVGTLIVVLGAFLLLGGAGLSIGLLLERHWWKKLVDGMMASPFPDFGLGPLIPMVQALMRSMTDRLFLSLKFGALLGGLVLGIIGVILVIFGVLIINV